MDEAFQTKELSLPILMQKVFMPRATSQRFQGMHAADHLASALREALMKSKYALVTKMVPGEADPYCARRARRKGGIVFTSDSDMLIYDLGNDGYIVYLTDLDLHAVPGSENLWGAHMCIHANEFRPREIAARLKLPNLTALAYVMKAKPSLEVQQIMNSREKLLPRDTDVDDVEGFEELKEIYNIDLSKFELSHFNNV